ncbi:MAG: GntR family transcriptional regulator [Candidatus Ornithospirochaeta sp.]|nr:GntR family transcriptional regulator [Candidatus Ornithospirochaeta sp.]
MAKDKLSDRAYYGILSLIQSGKYAAGDSLQESMLAEELHISRTPIREALQRLEDDMVVTIKPHLGAFVSSIGTDDLINLYSVREVIDSLIARTLCKPSVPAEPFLKLKEDFLKAIEIEDPVEQRRVLDIDAANYYSVFCEYCDNPIANKIFFSLKAKIDSLGNVMKSIIFFPLISAYERIEVIDAILAKDGDRAADKAKEHVTKTLQRILEVRIKQH